MANGDEWDQYRGSHEPQEHWDLRKEFLARNHEMVPDKVRLLCLSQAFANMEFLGCKYPTETMETVAELSRGIIEDYRQKKSGRLQRTFVKASDAAEKKTKGTKCPSEKYNIYSGSEASSSSCISNNNPTKVNKNGNAPSSSTSNHSSSSSNTNFTSQVNSQSLQLLLEQAMSGKNDSNTTTTTSHTILTNNLKAEPSQVQQQQQPPRFVPSTDIDHGWLEMAESTKKIKLNTMLPSLDDLKEVLKNCGQKEGITVRNLRGLLNDLKNIYIVVNQHSDSVSTLIHSLQASHKENGHKFNTPGGVQISEDGSFLVKCEFDLGKGNLIIRGVGKTMKDAKKDASTKALQLFQQLCPTLQVKETILAKRKVERSELIAEETDDQPQCDAKVMNMMLKMGWKGGGLGLKENGISQAIDVSQGCIPVRGRVGLGQEGKASDIAQFRKNLIKFLNGEARSYGEFDIEFSPDFTQPERKIIHEAATIVGCFKSKSHGKGDRRFLVLSRKIDLEKLVQQVLEHGGETEKYKVTLPKCCTAS